MSYMVEYGLDSISRQLLLLVLEIKDQNGKTGMDILHIHKTLRYYEYLQQKSEIDYSNFNMGAVSFELDENLKTLLESDLVDVDNSHYVLTSEGEKIAKELEQELSQKDLQKLAFAKQQLSKLTGDELMFFMYKLLPETQKNSLHYERLMKKQYPLVRSLFLKNCISASIAAKWLDTSEREFCASLSQQS